MSPHRSGPATAVAALTAIVAASTCIFAQEPAPDEATFLEWVGDTAIPVERWTMNDRLATYLDACVEGKRIVFIGEPGHFYSEKYDVQLMLIEHLVQRGYRHVFIEGLGASAAPIVDGFVTTGEQPKAAPEDDAAARYRERAFAEWVGADDPDFGARHKAGQSRFFKALRAMNEALPPGDPGLRIHPLDIDMRAGGCFYVIGDLLAAHANDDRLDPLRTLHARVDGEPIPERIERLERLRALVEDGAGDDLEGLSPSERLTLRKHVDCLVESIVFLDTARNDGRLNRALVRREPAMFRQVDYAIDALPKEAKCIMLAHTNHLCRSGADTTRARRPSVGEMICAAHPGEVFSIWMLYDHGHLMNPMSEEPIEALASDPRRVESLLVRAGSTYVLPLGTGQPGEAYLAAKRNYSYFSWFETGTLTLQTDAIFFLDEISPPA